MKKVTGKVHPPCDRCQKSEADRYCKQCAKFLCQQCLQPHDEWMTTHDTLDLNEVANAAYQLPHATLDTASNCPEHSEPTKIFCESCEELICQLCTVKVHRNHNLDTLNDAYTKHKLIVQQSSLQPLDQKINALNEAIANLIGKRKEMTEQGEKVKQSADKAISEIGDELLEQTVRNINEEADRVLEYKFTVTDHQIKEAKAVLSQLTEWRDHMQQSLAVDTPQQVLSTKAQMVSHTESLLATVKEKTFQPIEQANLRLVSNEEKSIESYIGTLEYSFTPLNTFTISFDHIPIVGQESTVNMSLSLEDGSPAPVPLSLISCHLTSSTSSSSPVQCIVKGTSSKPNQYSIVFTPCTRGYHQLLVKVHDCTILGDLVSIPVSIPVKMRCRVVKTIMLDNFIGLLLSHQLRPHLPRAIAVCDNGRVLIADCTYHRIVTFERGEHKVNRLFGSHGIGRGQFVYPWGIALTSAGTLLVVDYNSFIQEFTMDGECISCVGSKGNGPLQFNCPHSIAINKTTGQVYVGDTYNHRVQVLNADLTFSCMIGSHGKGQGQFIFPEGIAIDRQGFVFVSDCGNHRIQKFTPEGQFVSAFCSKGSKLGQLSHPIGIFINNDLLYVCEGRPNHRISVYTTTGQYVHCFGSSLHPLCLTMDTTTGYLYVCSGDGSIYVL